MTKHRKEGPTRGETQSYIRARQRARRRPAWWLRRREAQIVGALPRPSNDQLAELVAIRKELRLRDDRTLSW